MDVAAKLRFLLQQKYSGIFLGSNGPFLTGKSSFSQEERCIYLAVHRGDGVMSTVFKQEILTH